jgi:hypothetical protein
MIFYAKGTSKANMLMQVSKCIHQRTSKIHESIAKKPSAHCGEGVFD